MHCQPLQNFQKGENGVVQRERLLANDGVVRYLCLLIITLNLLVASATRSVSTNSCDCSDLPADRRYVWSASAQDRGLALRMLDSCLLCVCLSLDKKKENRRVFLADYIVFFCLLSVYLDLPTIHLYNLMLLLSG